VSRLPLRRALVKEFNQPALCKAATYIKTSGRVSWLIICLLQLPNCMRNLRFFKMADKPVETTYLAFLIDF